MPADYVDFLVRQRQKRCRDQFQSICCFTGHFKSPWHHVDNSANTERSDYLTTIFVVQQHASVRSAQLPMHQRSDPRPFWRIQHELQANRCSFELTLSLANANMCSTLEQLQVFRSAAIVMERLFPALRVLEPIER